MIAAVIILAILTAGTILTAVFIIERMGANINHLKADVAYLKSEKRALELKNEELKEKLKKERKKSKDGKNI